MNTATIQSQSIGHPSRLYRVFFANECVLETYDRDEAEDRRDRINAAGRLA